MEGFFDSYDDALKDESAKNIEDSLDKSKKELEDLDKRINNLEAGTADVHTKLSDLEKVIDPNDDYRKQLIEKLKDQLAAIDKDVKGERKGYNEAKSSFDDFEAKVNEKPLKERSVEDLKDLENTGKGIEDSIDEIKKDVGQSEDDLKRLLTELELFEKRMQADKSKESEKAFKDTQNNLEKLKKKLKDVNKNSHMLDSDIKMLDDGFVDLEKENEVKEIKEESSAEKETFKERDGEKDGFKKELDQI